MLENIQTDATYLTRFGVLMIFWLFQRTYALFRSLLFRNHLLLPVRLNAANEINYESVLDANKKVIKQKAPMGDEPMTSCLLDRRSYHLSYGASVDHYLCSNLVLKWG